MIPNSKLLMTISFIIVCLCVNSLVICSENYPNTITFNNQSGEELWLRLLGPMPIIAEIPQGQSKTVNVTPGEYLVLARYGINPDEYRFTKSNSFTVEQTATHYSTITITFNNYNVNPISQEEFEKAIAESEGNKPQTTSTVSPLEIQKAKPQQEDQSEDKLSNPESHNTVETKPAIIPISEEKPAQSVSANPLEPSTTKKEEGENSTLKPTITLKNQSSEPALVRLKGPTTTDVEVPAYGDKTVSVSGGDYFIKIRFGTNEAKYTYSKGDNFNVTETALCLSRIMITFNTLWGNYNTNAISKEDFWS